MKIKFKGKVYEDAWRSETDGHIWFGGNEFEHVPKKTQPYYQPGFTYQHSFKPSGNGFVRTSKKSTAKVEIVEEG